MLFLQVFIVRKGGSAYNKKSIGRKQGGREYGQQENGCSDFGGQSSEHEVSRTSAVMMLQALDKEKYQVLSVGITKKGSG